MRLIGEGAFNFGRGSAFVSLGRPLRNPMLGSMQDDIAWFEANRISIAQQYAGQYVVVKNQAVVGAFPDFQSAYNAGTGMFGSEPFVVKEAKAQETPIRLVGGRP